MLFVLLCPVPCAVILCPLFMTFLMCTDSGAGVNQEFLYSTEGFFFKDS